MSMEGDELNIFLLCHLGHTSLGVHYFLEFSGNNLFFVFYFPAPRGCLHFLDTYSPPSSTVASCFFLIVHLYDTDSSASFSSIWSSLVITLLGNLHNPWQFLYHRVSWLANLIISATSMPLCHVIYTYFQVLGIGTWMPFKWGHHSAFHSLPSSTETVMSVSYSKYIHHILIHSKVSANWSIESKFNTSSKYHQLKSLRYYYLNQVWLRLWL